MNNTINNANELSKKERKALRTKELKDVLTYIRKSVKLSNMNLS